MADIAAKLQTIDMKRKEECCKCDIYMVCITNDRKVGFLTMGETIFTGQQGSE